MALPIGITPILRGKDAFRLVKRMCSNGEKTVGLVPTPKLSNVDKLIKKFSENGQK